MPPAAESPLVPLTKGGAWQRHARSFDAAFERLDRRQLARIRAWSAKNLTASSPTMFYMFSGPDFLYANAFYPNAKTYVLAGLEPVGAVPDLTKLRSVAASLSHLEYSLGSILSYSFFVTKKMKSNLRAGPVNGTLPILYVFLARSGKTIRDVTPVALDAEGVVQPEGDNGSAAHGVKIVFAGEDGEARTLYYFSTNLADSGFAKSGFAKFLEGLAPGDSLLKSASYLLHSGGFSRVRDFLLNRSALLVQDDSGIPLRHYDRQQWDLRPFGRYLGPIGIFPGRYQANYAVLFRNSQPIDFGIGYRWRPNQSNLLLAVKRSGASMPVATTEPTSTEQAPTAGLGQDRENSAARQAVRKHRSTARRTKRRVVRSRATPSWGWFASPFWGARGR
ncbi:MAG: hypothetical protein R3D62_20235 [Xanthobacteraceae bacterium]